MQDLRNILFESYLDKERRYIVGSILLSVVLIVFLLVQKCTVVYTTNNSIWIKTQNISSITQNISSIYIEYVSLPSIKLSQD